MSNAVSAPPSGALSPIDAAAKFHRKLWRRLQIAEKALAEFDAKGKPRRQGWMSRSGFSHHDFLRARPGEFGLGHTSTPAEQRRALVGEVNSAIDRLEAALIAQLIAGEMIAYVIPAKLSDPYLTIKPRLWKLNIKLSLRAGTVTGDRFAREKILIVRNSDLPAAMSTLKQGRPDHPLKEEIMTLYWATVPSETDRKSKAQHIRNVLESTAAQHPQQKIPSPKTVSQWIEKKKYQPG